MKRRSQKWASLISYGLTVEALTAFLPVDETLNGELASVFQHWYPDFPVEEGEAQTA
jgi:hypothetical protein